MKKTPSRKIPIDFRGKVLQRDLVELMGNAVLGVATIANAMRRMVLFPGYSNRPSRAANHG
jgi:hypothetical protein